MCDDYAFYYKMCANTQYTDGSKLFACVLGNHPVIQPNPFVYHSQLQMMEKNIVQCV